MTDIPASLARCDESVTAPRRFSNREAREEWSRSVTTREGVQLMIVPASMDDSDALIEFFDSVTPEDLYFRFLSGIRRVDEDRIRAMLRDDDDRTIDFLALDQDTGKVLATAMLVADAAFDSAEFAVCTRSDAKNQGVSWTLLDHAASYAQSMGVRRIFSVQSSCQADALRLEREMGFSIKMCPGDAREMLAEKIFHPA